MTWTYSGDPSNSNRDAVRFLIGDTDGDDHQLADEELDWLLSENNDRIYGTAIHACESLASKYARQMDKRLGQSWIDASQRFDHYLVLSQRLRDVRRVVEPVGSVFLGNKDSERRVFELGQFDSEYASKQFETTTDDEET